jgi:hypothetical protein
MHFTHRKNPGGYMKRLVTILPLILFCFILSAQAMSVQGLVSDSVSNKPVTDARLIAYTFTANGDSLVFEVISDSSGSFSFGDLPDGVYDLRCEHPLFFAQFRRFVQITAADMALYFHFRLHPRLTPYNNYVAGHVYSAPEMLPAFIPLENATITLAGEVTYFTARSNQEGAFKFRNLPPGPYLVSAFAPGHIPKYNFKTIVVRHNTKIDTLDIFLKPYDTNVASLSGHVYDRNSNLPVYPAMISLYGIHAGIADSIFFETKNNPDGSYKFEKLPPGIYRAECVARGYRTFVARALEITQDDVIFDFYLSPSDTVIENYISGIVFNTQTSLPVYDARVDLVSIIPDGSLMPVILYSTRTDDQGRFTFKSINPWKYQITAWAPGFESSQPDTLLIEKNTQIRDLRLEIKPKNLNEPVSLSGFVYDSSVDASFAPNPIYPAEIVLLHSNSAGVSIVYSTITNPDGSYRIDNIKPYNYTIWCHAAGYQRKVIHNVNLYIDTKLNFFLESQFPPGHGYISGRVLFDHSNKPVEGAILTFFSTNSFSGFNHYAITDSSGFYNSPLVPGKYYVSCSYFGSTDYYYFYQEFYDNAQTISDATPVEIHPNQVTGRINFGIPELPVITTVQISGVVTDDNNNPLPRARINIWALHPPLVTDASQIGYNTWTRDDGSYDITIRLPGWHARYGFIVSAHKSGYATEFFKEKSVPYLADILWAWKDTSFTDIDFTLEPLVNTHSISGLVGGSNGDIIPNAYVLGFRPSTGDVVFTTTDSSGRYTLAPLHRDVYYILFIAQGYVAEFYDDALLWEDATPVFVSGHISGIGAKLRPQPTLYANAIIAGYIYDTGNDALPGVLVTAENSSGDVIGSSLTNSEGYYEMPYAEAGLHILHATRVNYKSLSTSVRLESTAAPMTMMDMSLEQSVLNLPEDPPGIPDELKLLQNYPNPFNPTTTIRFMLPSTQHVRLLVYNILGQPIRQLLDQPMVQGPYTVTWDGTDRFGRVVSSGIYFLSLETASQRQVKKMIFSK